MTEGVCFFKGRGVTSVGAKERHVADTVCMYSALAEIVQRRRGGGYENMG